MVAVAIQPNKEVNVDVKSKETLADDVIRWCESFESTLKSKLQLPAGYVHLEVGHRFRWFLGCPILSTEAGSSWRVIRVNETEGARHDPNQWQMEVRFFWPEQTVRQGRQLLTYHQYSGPDFRATLWMQMGASSGYEFIDLLKDQCRFVRAESAEALAELCATELNAVVKATERICFGHASQE